MTGIWAEEEQAVAENVALKTQSLLSYAPRFSRTTNQTHVPNAHDPYAIIAARCPKWLCTTCGYIYSGKFVMISGEMYILHFTPLFTEEAFAGHTDRWSGRARWSVCWMENPTGARGRGWYQGLLVPGISPFSVCNLNHKSYVTPNFKLYTVSVDQTQLLTACWAYLLAAF